MKAAATLALLACLVGTATAQPFNPGTGFAPLGNLLTSDQDGPYSLAMVPTQVAEIRGAWMLWSCTARTCCACAVRIDAGVKLKSC